MIPKLHFEQRRDTRVLPAPGKPVEVQIMGSGFLDVFRARDISVGGVAIFDPHQLEGCDIAAELQLIVTLPGGRPFLARGSIRHVSLAKSVFGVQFTDLPSKHRAALEQYVEARLREGGAAPKR